MRITPQAIQDLLEEALVDCQARGSHTASGRGQASRSGCFWTRRGFPTSTPSTSENPRPGGIVEGAAAALEQVYHAGLASITDETLYIGAEIKAFQAQQIVINLVLEATTLLFEVGGASATSLTRSFDRHWRNARTVASHNPAIYRERAIGDYYLNGQKPDAAWRALREKLTKGESQTNTTDSVSTFDDLSTEFDGKSQTSA